MHATLKAAERQRLAELMACEPQFDCSDVCVSDPNDVFDGTDSDISHADHAEGTEDDNMKSESAKDP